MALPHLPAFPRHLVRASRADETQGEGSEGVPPPARGPHTDVPREGGAGRAGSWPTDPYV